VFAYLQGTIKSKEITGAAIDRLVIDIAGIGFEVNVANRTLLTVGAVGDEIVIYTALSIKETEWTIFGFASPLEKELFLLLQSVSGIGPKLALTLVASFTPEQLAEAIISEDQKLITQAPGVGAKVAQRIILELKSKVEDWQQKRLLPRGTQSRSSPVVEEVRSILIGLGYTNTEVNTSLAEARKANIEDDVEVLIRFALKALGAPVAT
jgi:Holliday junction DNA helicase RuvA